MRGCHLPLTCRRSNAASTRFLSFCAGDSNRGKCESAGTILKESASADAHTVAPRRDRPVWPYLFIWIVVPRVDCIIGTAISALTLCHHSSSACRPHVL